MGLPTDPRLPDWTLPRLAERLTQRLTALLREWAAVLNPWIGPSWEDLRFPAQGINPAGAPTAASYDTTTYPGTLLFAGNAENHVAGVAQMPHSWREGTAIRPHIHWTKTVADAGGAAVTWEIRFALGAINEVVGAYGSYIAATLTVGDLTTAEKHNLSSFGDLDMTGLRGSDMVLWQLRRRGDTDAYNSPCRLLEFDFHYQIGQVGSSNKKEFPD